MFVVHVFRDTPHLTLLGWENFLELSIIHRIINVPRQDTFVSLKVSIKVGWRGATRLFPYSQQLKLTTQCLPQSIHFIHSKFLLLFFVIVLFLFYFCYCLVLLSFFCYCLVLVLFLLLFFHTKVLISCVRVDKAPEVLWVRVSDTASDESRQLCDIRCGSIVVYIIIMILWVQMDLSGC